jgi:NADH dehydrogenase
MKHSPRVIIVGGGFAGLQAARRLGRAPVHVTLIDRRNVHLFQPLLYQVATGGLSPGDVTSPLRSIVKRNRNTRVMLAEMQDFEPEKNRILLRDGELAYDYLVVAAGATNHYFGHGEWAAFAPGLKSIEDALSMRRRILLAFEAAERETDPDARDAWLTFVVIGGGPTGVELAGAINELARRTLKNEFRSIDPACAKVVLLEGGERVLPQYGEDASRRAKKSLRRIGVHVILKARATDIDREGVSYQHGGTEKNLSARTCLWAAGIKPSPLAECIAKRTGVATDRAGRITVRPDLSLPEHPDVFVIGDLAAIDDGSGGTVPGVAPAAIQQGNYAARRICDRLDNRTTEPFRYRDRGSLAVIGRNRAVAEFGRFTFSGWPAWCFWSLLHIHFLIEFNNKFLVMSQWAIDYLTRKRGARFISRDAT